MMQYGTSEIPDYIDVFIHDFMLDKLSETESQILDKWMEKKGNIILFTRRVQHWKGEMVKKQMEKQTNFPVKL